MAATTTHTGAKGNVPRPPELAGTGRVAHVSRAPEDDRVQPGGLHAFEQAPAAFLAEPGEVDACAVLERHHAGVHRATSKGSYRVPLSGSQPSSVTATMSSER